MTLDEHLGRAPDAVGERRRVTPQRSTSRDLERYASLFASRTRVMRSSAMRDLMAVSYTHLTLPTTPYV